MRSDTRGDMKYSGIMTMPGGTYKRVDLDGVITIDGDIDCREIRVNGVFNGNGKVKSNTGKINGVANIQGGMESDEIDINGDLKIGDDMAVHEVNGEGRLSVKGNIVSENFDLRGELTVKGNCDAEAFGCKGAFRIDGTLNAGDVSVNLYGPSNVKEIGGGKISVRKGGSRSVGILTTLFLPIVYGKAHLIVDTIEGDEVSIEHTTAKAVRGGTVVIGDGCEIDLVEYRTDFKKAAGASVLKHVKV